MCRSTCFGRLHAHHQELTTALTAFGFALERGGSSAIGRGRADQPDNSAGAAGGSSIVSRGRPDHD